MFFTCISACQHCGSEHSRNIGPQAPPTFTRCDFSQKKLDDRGIASRCVCSVSTTQPVPPPSLVISSSIGNSATTKTSPAKKPGTKDVFGRDDNEEISRWGYGCLRKDLSLPSAVVPTEMQLYNDFLKTPYLNQGKENSSPSCNEEEIDRVMEFEEHVKEITVATVQKDTVSIVEVNENASDEITAAAVKVDQKRPDQYQEISENIFLSQIEDNLDYGGECACEDGVCGVSCVSRYLTVECRRCPSGDKCTNKRMQQKKGMQVEVFHTGSEKGFGVRALEPIKKGSFIIEYLGEVVTHEMGEKRKKQYAREFPTRRHHYLMRVTDSKNHPFLIDATKYGNSARFINHSCEPNTICDKWSVNRRFRMGFFAKKNIATGEEITFDYRFQNYGRILIECACGAPNCRRYLSSKDAAREEEESVQCDRETSESSSSGDDDDEEEEDEEEEEEELEISQEERKKLRKEQAERLLNMGILTKKKQLELRSAVMIRLTPDQRNLRTRHLRLRLASGEKKIKYSEMGDTREKYSENDMKIMIDFLYRMCSSKDDELRKLADVPKGYHLWELLVKEQRRKSPGSKCDHSSSSLTTKYRKYLVTKMHRVKGVIPEQVLFIYRYHMTTFPNPERTLIKNAFPNYEIIFDNGRIISFHRMHNVQRTTDESGMVIEKKRKEDQPAAAAATKRRSGEMQMDEMTPVVKEKKKKTTENQKFMANEKEKEDERKKIHYAFMESLGLSPGRNIIDHPKTAAKAAVHPQTAAAAAESILPSLEADAAAAKQIEEEAAAAKEKTPSLTKLVVVSEEKKEEGETAADATAAAAAATSPSAVQRRAGRRIHFNDDVEVIQDRNEASSSDSVICLKADEKLQQLQQLLLKDDGRDPADVASEVERLLEVILPASKTTQLVKCLRETKIEDNVMKKEQEKDAIKPKTMEKPIKRESCKNRIDTAEKLTALLKSLNTGDRLVEVMRERCEAVKEMYEDNEEYLGPVEDEKILDRVMDSLDDTIESVLLDDDIFEE